MKRTLPPRSTDTGTGTPARGEPEPPPRSPLVRALAMVVALAATVLFAVVLARLTLTPSYASEALTHSNLRPGDSIRAYLDQPAFRDTVKQLGGNILLGVPFGVLLPVAWPRARGLLRVVALTALVMAMVELVQGFLVPGRAFDIDDVILNTSGALLGYLLLGRRLGRAVHPPRRRWWQRRRRAGRDRAATAGTEGT
ncbi:VanZ family protein [Streptomyces macrosporus]|uniref:VanZ-like domain-containing protein n=1 Tax=Streptomyces macrosporus TaxID=44032 RepID=A0ABP5XJW2_9ACTN